MIVKYYKDDGTLLKEITIDAEEEKALGTSKLYKTQGKARD